MMADSNEHKVKMVCVLLLVSVAPQKMSVFQILLYNYFNNSYRKVIQLVTVGPNVNKR